MRLRLCAPSRVNASLLPWRSNSVPHSISSWIAPGPSSTSACTAARSQRPSPANSVSCSCSSTSSSSLNATAMPPCAYSEEDSRRLSLAMTRTVPASASSIAARNPATPAPITRKSGFMGLNASIAGGENSQDWASAKTGGLGHTRSMLLDAIRSGDADQVRSLLAADASLYGTKTPEGASAVLWSVYTRHADLAPLLLGEREPDFFEACAL